MRERMIQSNSNGRDIVVAKIIYWLITMIACVHRSPIQWSSNTATTKLLISIRYFYPKVISDLLVYSKMLLTYSHCALDLHQSTSSHKAQACAKKGVGHTTIESTPSLWQWSTKFHAHCGFHQFYTLHSSMAIMTRFVATVDVHFPSGLVGQNSP